MLKRYSADQIRSLACTGMLLNGLVHNISTPLSAAMGRAEMAQLRCERIRQHITDPDVLDEFDRLRQDIGRVFDNCTRVGTLLHSSRQRRAVADQNDVRPVNIGCLLREDLEFLMSDMRLKNNIEKCFRIETTVPPIMGVSVHFSNSFIEIIDNALAAMAHSDEQILTVSVQAAAGRVAVAVSDTGCGMDEQIRHAVMQTLEFPPKRPEESSGGLAYAAAVLRSYRPVYEVDSSPGRTTVSVFFPL